mmetsp:Transcript_19113/g.22037  ORF Transcript_19113/g.22037 Transcript_19113/m.22037 type:complete len:116 (+) Transcript_19113:464-811(+)
MPYIIVVPFIDFINHYNVDTSRDFFCPRLHSVSVDDTSNPLYDDAMEYQTQRRMNLKHSEFYKAVSQPDVKPTASVSEQLQLNYNSYWLKVQKREEMHAKSPANFEDENAKDIWD